MAKLTVWHSVDVMRGLRVACGKEAAELIQAVGPKADVPRRKRSDD